MQIWVASKANQLTQWIPYKPYSFINQLSVFRTKLYIQKEKESYKEKPFGNSVPRFGFYVSLQFRCFSRFSRDQTERKKESILRMQQPAMPSDTATYHT